MDKDVDMVVVYKANRESLPEVIRLLRREGFSPITLENPSPTVIYASGYKYLISIAVPRDQVPGAKSVLRRWDEARRPEVKKLTSGLSSQFFKSLLLLVPFVVVFWCFGILADFASALAVIWIVLFVLIANAQWIKDRFTGATSNRPHKNH
ncbi:MAG: hypothetical protein JSU94_07785 [Phycisphaerales bacterium]|nr:MAG: hypothetical protein JSU94_07785 [Phycisphaerales bacterium]